MEYKDYYKILGVERSASQDDIKRAYKKLARKYHPDVSKEPNAEDRFKEIGESYEVLKDPEKRAAYDRLGSGWQHGQDFRPPPGWDTGFEFRGGGYTDADAADFSDFFENLFGDSGPFGGFRPRGAGGRGGFGARGEDHHARIRVSLEDAYHGCTRRIELERPEVDASGHVTTRSHHIDVKLPKGISNGQQIRVAGKGTPGMGGGPPGDLYLEVQIAEHPLYEVDGRDIYLNLPVTPWEAALGAKVPVPTLGGRVDLKIPAGSGSGRKLRLKGRGLPGKTSGDQYVVLQIMTPPADSEQAKELYRKMAETMPFNPRKKLGV